MSTRQRGNKRENVVMRHLEDLGYFCYASRGSRGIDIIALSPKDQILPHLGIEAGGRSKSVKEAFAKMRASANFPGMLLLVVREVKVKNRNRLRWHATDGVHGHDSFESALEAAGDL